MKKNVNKIIDNMIKNTEELNNLNETTVECVETIIKTYNNKGKVLLCGNGGSCADCDHIVGELMKGFLKSRPVKGEVEKALKEQFGDKWCNIKDNLQQGLPAISLCTHNSLTTAFNNDVNPNMVFAQQVLGYGNKGDVLIAMSTSGNSSNVVYAVKTAKALGLKTVGFTGQNGGKLKQLCDLCFCVPSNQTYRIQEYHISIYHAVCAAVEECFFEN